MKVLRLPLAALVGAMLNLAFSMILYAALLRLYWVTGGTDGIGVRTSTFLGLMPPRTIVRMS
jgi:ABC-type branched-subunit amino acid transport system permease subunit